MDLYRLEQINQLRNSREERIQEMVDRLEPVVGEYIQESIAWETDGDALVNILDGDEYLEFVIEIRNRLLKQLQ